jgi:carboxylate-amine ligase
MRSDFAKGEFGTLGVEYEIEVIGRATSSPLPIASELASTVQPRLSRGAVTPDLFASTLELATGICESLSEVVSDLRTMTNELAPALDLHEATLLGMGLHPFARAENALVAQGERYREIMDLIAWPARRVPTNSIQIHVGMPSGDHAVATARSLRPLLPILLALSASSPFRNGEITGLASTRSALFASVPRSGPMPEFENWEVYSDYCAAMALSNSMPTDLHIWWDCRLQPTLGTIEIRIADSVADLDDILAIVALAWCMAVGVDELRSFAIPSVLSDENRWRAVRYGSACRILTDDYGNTEPLSTTVERLLVALEATADRLDCRQQLERCIDLSRGTSVHQKLVPEDSVKSELDLAYQATQSMRVTW